MFVRHALLLCCLFGFFTPLVAQTKGGLIQGNLIQVEDVTIHRDSFGVPHIVGKTNADVAYGLAWAHAEDDFASIQHNLLPASGNLGRALGKQGVLFDYAVKFLAIDEYVAAHFDQDISSEFQVILAAYCQGLNDFAARYPEQVLVRRALPFTPRDVITGYTVNLSLMGGVGMALKAINDNAIEAIYAPNNKGSNAIALAPERTEDGATWLCINSHQPIEGPFAWYEAHLVSDEGMNILGGLFPGAVSVTLGSNENLGWAHTTNYNQWGDVYALEIDPKNNHNYRYDGEWRPFRTRKIKLHVKLGPVVIGVKRTLEFSEYGPVFRAKHGVYALRFHAYENIRAAEQWHRMNLANNLVEFEQEIQREGITSFNIIYADKVGNIYFQSNGAYPLRNPELDWTTPVAGISSGHRWTELLPYDQKPVLLNPECGYVYNANNTPLEASGSACNWTGNFPGLQRFTYNRGERLKSLLEAHEGPFSWSDFLAIKFDKAYQPDGLFRDRFRIFFDLVPEDHPELADAIRQYQQWTLTADSSSTTATLPMVTHYFLARESKLPFAFLMIRDEPVSEADALQALKAARDLLLRGYGRLDVPLGQVQRYTRGEASYPANGAFEVARAADASLVNAKKGQFRIKSGDGYMQMVKFHPDRPVEIHTINAYGASAHQDSPHFTDQMPLFAAEQFRILTLDRETLQQRAKISYHPGAVNYR